MTHKTCSSCGLHKSEEEFSWRSKSKGVRHNLCKKCRSAQMLAYRLAHPDKTHEVLSKADKVREARVRAGEVQEPETKRCFQCQEVKPLSEFRWRNRRLLRRVARCKSCDIKIRAERYRKNPEQYVDNNRRNYAKLRAIVDEAKAVPCADCHQEYPPFVLDFDHRDPSLKIKKISAMVYWGSEKMLREEMAKCDVVCANCHRLRTFGRRKE